MKDLTKNEMKNIKGGGLSAAAIIGIGALVTFLAGIIDGFVRPLGCNK